MLKSLTPALLAAGFLAGATGAFAQESARTNILILLADDLGWADVGFNGSNEVKTPHLDSLAQNGARFTAGYVTAPQCSPSRAGLLSGRYQQRMGHENNLYNTATLQSGQKIFPEHFKPAGYATEIVGKWHLGDGSGYHPLQHGFDEFFGFLGGAHAYWKERWQDRENPIVHANTKAFQGALVLDGTKFLTTRLGEEGAGFIRRNQSRPWFLYMAFNAPHTPVMIPPGYREKVKDIKNKNRAAAVAMLMNLDDACGNILDTLRSTGQENRTLIFFLSDNGGTSTPSHIEKNGSLNVPYRGVKGDIYDGGIREPFVVQWKGHISEGKTYDTPVSSLDILPTALAAAQLKPLPDSPLDGVSLLPLLTGASSAAPNPVLYWRFDHRDAVRQGDWKWDKVGNEPDELYNLSSDPSEQKNLAGQMPEKVKELSGLWARWDSANPPLGKIHPAVDRG